jgi:Class II Aldolase and Adducin N-terminal domain
MPEVQEMSHLKDLWDEQLAQRLGSNELALLRYRSNLLGADLRITNFGGGNTSTKFELPDPFTAEPVRVMAVKGSGGDLGSITEAGFAILYLGRLEQLKRLYRGEAHEDEIVRYYPLCAFGENRVAASIDTPLHAFLPFAHVDHLHPDWVIALAANANGRRKREEFNHRFRTAGCQYYALGTGVADGETTNRADCRACRPSTRLLSQRSCRSVDCRNRTCRRHSAGHRR